MISVEEAEARILGNVQMLGREWITLDRALNRVLADDLAARRTQPPTAVSAMDGYAVIADDTRRGVPLRIIGEVPAGQRFERPLAPGEAVRIFTGAPLPKFADAIIIQENATRESDQLRYDGAVEAGRYVREAGLDFIEGWVGLRQGTRLGPRALGLAATLCHLWLPVVRQPRIGLLATGDELAWPGMTPMDHQHVSSNTTTLAAMCRNWGAEPVDLGIAPDTHEALHEAMSGLEGLDLLVTTGGASVGEYDLIRSAYGEDQLRLDFWKIAMRPGKPLMFGELHGTPLLGLPGNPVSASVCSLIFLRPVIAKMLGRSADLPIKRMRLRNELGSNDERQDYVRATSQLIDGEIWVKSAARQDSSMFATFALADTLIVRPPFDDHKSIGDTIAAVEINSLL